MKKLSFFLLLLIPAGLFLVYTSFRPAKKSRTLLPEKHIPNTTKMAVLELFTSQGCSSCPPADRLLGKYINMENVIALSFHVDYWNRLGWTDSFSSDAFSQRQKDYAAAFKLNGVYTPQLVINGEREMVGSDENKLSSALTKMQENVSDEHVSINEVKLESNKATISCTIEGRKDNSILNIALVQNKAVTSIRAGENQGVSLTNYNVVRKFKSMAPATEGSIIVSIDLIPGIDKKELSVIAFLQNSDTYRISAADQSSL